MRIGRAVYIGMDSLSGAVELLAGAISYMLGVCAPIGAAELTLPTPCPDWDLAMLLGHLCQSMADLETALRTGRLDLDEPIGRAGGDPVEALRDGAAQLLCAGYCYGGPECFVAVGGLPMPAGLVACTGAVEIAVHGWDVSAARARAGRDSTTSGSASSVEDLPDPDPGRARHPDAAAEPAARGRPRGPVRRPGRGSGPGQPGRPAGQLPRAAPGCRGIVTGK